MKIAFAQINPTLGDKKRNLAIIENTVKHFHQEKPDIIIFPECAITGYPPEDLLLLDSFKEEFSHAAEECAAYFTETIGIFGGIDYHQGLLYNTAFTAFNGTIQKKYYKQLLPNYGVFDEKRYFQNGSEIQILTIKQNRILITVCEDIWEPEKWLYKTLKNEKIDGIINISASPYHINKKTERIHLLKNICENHETWFAYCNCVGGQDELVFDGNSLFIDKNRDIIYQGKSFEEDYSIVDVDNHQKNIISKEENTQEEIYKAIVLGLKDYVEKNGFKKVVLGISGGIDSALTAAVAVDALGKENVFGITMPSEYSSKGSIDDSEELAKNFGFQLETIAIKNINQIYLTELDSFFKNSQSGLAEENIQARIRGNIVMAFSNKFGYLALTTGNKSEVSVGYCTMYGDMAGGFSVLKDIYKTVVYQLAEYRNKKAGFDIIPLSTITKPPSAELRPNQKDSDSLPEYHILDKILEFYVEKGESIQQIVNKGFEKDIVEKTARLVRNSEFKRRQACPGIKITSRAYGKDRRFPITNRWGK